MLSDGSMGRIFDPGKISTILKYSIPKNIRELKT